MTISLIYGNFSTAPLCARAALATSRLGKPYIRFHQIMMVMTSMTMVMMVMKMMPITVLATFDAMI